ncbi:MAG: triose-phosphate isomerase, partial [Coriobacteriia bacterium]|nr:triose-phosphate isomerase [Coriobacteriia bacterium]
TGEISAPMLEHFGVEYVIIGHSERRAYFNETDETVNKKTKTALEVGLVPIVCVGESLKQREQGITIEFIRKQIKLAMAGILPEDAVRVVIAYEPIWAIGTGKTATPKMAEEVCAHIRGVLEDLFGETIAENTRILYGGSVNGGNAELFFSEENIDGALVGGAALDASDFAPIIAAAASVFYEPRIVVD